MNINGYMEQLQKVGTDVRTHANVQVERICQRLDDIAQAVESLELSEERIRIPAQDDADGAGLAIIRFPIERAGYVHTIEHVTSVVDAGVAAIGVLYVGNVEQWNVAHVLDDADFYATAAPINILVPPGVSELVLRITGAPANAKCYGAVQVLRQKKTY